MILSTTTTLQCSLVFISQLGSNDNGTVHLIYGLYEWKEEKDIKKLKRKI